MNKQREACVAAAREYLCFSARLRAKEMLRAAVTAPPPTTTITTTMYPFLVVCVCVCECFLALTYKCRSENPGCKYAKQNKENCTTLKAAVAVAAGRSCPVPPRAVTVIHKSVGVWREEKDRFPERYSRERLITVRKKKICIKKM